MAFFNIHQTQEIVQPEIKAENYYGAGGRIESTAQNIQAVFDVKNMKKVLLKTTFTALYGDSNPGNAYKLSLDRPECTFASSSTSAHQVGYTSAEGYTTYNGKTETEIELDVSDYYYLACTPNYISGWSKYEIEVIE